MRPMPLDWQGARIVPIWDFGSLVLRERDSRMRRKPLIGLNADYRPSRKEGLALTYVPAGYYNAIQASGGIPLILPPMEDKNDLVRVLELVQGFVLVGGGDLDPRRDGFQLH